MSFTHFHKECLYVIFSLCTAVYNLTKVWTCICFHHGAFRHKRKMCLPGVYRAKTMLAHVFLFFLVWLLVKVHSVRKHVTCMQSISLNRWFQNCILLQKIIWNFLLAHRYCHLSRIYSSNSHVSLKLLLFCKYQN